jgi:hypothetical protein
LAEAIERRRYSVAKTSKPKVPDLRDNVPGKAIDPTVARELDELKPLVVVDEPGIVRPGSSVQSPGQATHE